MKTKIVYKLLHNRNGEGFYSWSSPTGCGQEYFLNKINRPKIRGSGIFVFDTLAEALAFDKFNERWRAVFECEATNVRKQKVRMQVNADLKEVKSFWKNWRKTRKNRLGEIQDGVSLCDTLKLLRRLQ